MLSKLAESGKSLVFTWVPSHCGLPGNELADRVAGQACQLDQAEVEAPFDACKAAIKRRRGTRAYKNQRTRLVYGDSGGVKRELEKA